MNGAENSVGMTLGQSLLCSHLKKLGSTMKFLFVALCLGGGVLASGPSQEFEGPLCPVADPSWKEGPVFLNAHAPPVVDLGGILTNIMTEGFSTGSWKLYVGAEGDIEIGGALDSKLERATGNATYTAFGALDAHPLRQETLPSGNFRGAGLGTFSGTNVQIKGNATFLLDFILDTLELKTLTIESLHFDSFSFDLGAEFVIGGETPNWAELSANFKVNFEQDWANDRDGVTELIRQIFNGFHPYSYTDLVDLITGNVEC